MKNAVMIFVSAMLCIITLAVVLTIGGSMNRRTELQSNLSSVIEMTVEQMAGEAKASATDHMAVAQCIACMAEAMDTDSELVVQVYQADMQKGVLSMKFTENFYHPNGKSGVAEWERTAICNKLGKVHKKSYEVRFYPNRKMMLQEGMCYKVYEMKEGDRILPPVEPQMEGASFAGWLDRNDYMADFSQPVSQNLVYYAAWE